MRFLSHSIRRGCSLLCGVSLLSSAAFALPQTGEQIKTSNKKEQYLIVLSDVASSAIQNKNQTQAIAEQQADFIKSLKKEFADISLASQRRVLGNTLTVNLTAEQAELVSSMPGVQHVHATTGLVPLPKPMTIKQTLTAVEQPQVVDSDLGRGVSVAIISTGIDYTHQLLGGEGTVEAYEKAWKYADVPFDGFPTSVVTKGLDFFGERVSYAAYHDFNPIDSAYDPNGESGSRGTALASIIHQLAPSAELWSAKVYRASKVGANVVPYQPTVDIVAQALEWALDPDGDGDTSDKADIILLDISGFGPGYYSNQDVWIGDYARLGVNIQKAATLGSVVIVPQGSGEQLSHYATPIQAVAPAAISVGTTQSIEDDSAIYMSSTSLHGPVRGDIDAIKPDLVDSTDAVQVALVGTGSEQASASDAVFAAAKVAAAAAVVKSENSALTGLEVKAILMNSANSNVLNRDGSEQAEVTHSGAGKLQQAEALKNTAVAFSLPDGQPSLHLGNLDIADNETRTVTEQVYVKNLTDKAITYDLSITQKTGGPSHAALTWQLPSSVTVEAHRAMAFPVSVTIDGALLEKWPLVDAKDYTLENWCATELDGDLHLTASNDESLSAMHLPWLLRARPATSIQAHYDTYQEYYGSVFLNEPGDNPLGESLFEDFFAREQAFENTSATDATFTVLPTVGRKTEISEAANGAKSSMIIENLASAVVPEEQCESKQKLSLGLTFHSKQDLAFRTYFDRSDMNGTIEFFIFRESFLEMYPDTAAGTLLNYASNADLLLYGFIDIDEQNVPTAYYVDASIAADPSNPSANLKQSSLPIRFATDSRGLLVDYCTDELIRDDLPAEEFDRNLGYFVRTVRDQIPSTGDAPLLFNPVNMGPKVVTISYDWFGNQIESISNEANYVKLSKAPGAQAVENYHSEMTLAPGEQAYLTAMHDGYCDYRTVCGKGFVLFSNNADYHMWSRTKLSDQSGAIAKPSAGQQFDVFESAQAGDLVGQIQLESINFFNIGPGEAGDIFGTYQFYLANPLIDDALALMPDGRILVNNPASLNAETNSEYVLSVFGQMRDNNVIMSSTTDITVNVSSLNINAPVLVDSANTQLQSSAGEALNIAINALFTDADSDTLLFSSNNLPAGLTLSDDGVLAGSVSSAASYDFTISVSDSRHQTSQDFTLVVTQEAEQSTHKSSGSTGLFILLMMALWVYFKRAQRTAVFGIKE